MKEIKLKRLDERLFSTNGIIYYNYETSIACVKEIINVLVDADWIDRISIETINEYNGEYDRAYYYWQSRVINSIEVLINRVSQILNTQGLLLPPDYQELGNIGLYKYGYILMDNSFSEKMNKNFVKIENRINDFYKILEDAKLFTE